MVNYEKRFDEVLEKIEAARVSTDEYNIVKIVVASKYATIDDIKSIYHVGQRAFGENRVQEFEKKSKALENIPLEWHFIGRLQTNKINKLIDLNPSLVQSCDSYKMAQEIDKRLKVKNKKLNILLQINSAKNPSQAGVKAESAIEEYLKIKEELTNLNLKGVMSIGAHSENPIDIIKSFDITYKIFEQLKPYGAKYCSMGMSADFEQAIKCGSNMVRLGNILFK